MSGKAFPTFAEGMDEQGMSATEMQTMSDAAKQADGLRPGPGAQIRRGPAGNVISIDPTRGSHILSHTRFVAVVVPPTKVDTHVMVRDVVYKIEEPEPIDIVQDEPDEIVDLIKGEYTYRWGSPHRIRARPGYGMVPMDFAGDVYKDVDVNGTPIAPIAAMPIFWLELRGEGPPLLWPLNTKLKRQFKIALQIEGGGIYDNHLRVHTWAGLDETEGEEIIQIARPWDLRANPETYSRHGFTYDHVSALERIASREDPPDSGIWVTETQVIIPPWRVGDVVYASSGIAGGLDGAWGPNLPFTWLADGDSRAWAEKNPAHV